MPEGERLRGLFPPGPLYRCPLSRCPSFQRAGGVATRYRPMGPVFGAEEYTLRQEVARLCCSLIWRWCSRAYLIQQASEVSTSPLLSDRNYFSLLTASDSRNILREIDRLLHSWLNEYEELCARGLPHLAAQGCAAAVHSLEYRDMSWGVQELLLNYFRAPRIQEILPIPYLAGMKPNDRDSAVAALLAGKPLPLPRLQSMSEGFTVEEIESVEELYPVRS